MYFLYILAKSIYLYKYSTYCKLLATMNILSDIVGVVDAQGYIVNDIFYPVELAVVGDGYSYSYRLATNLNLSDMSPKDKEHCDYVYNHIHKIALNPLDYKCKYNSGEVAILICRIYQELKKQSEFQTAVLGCKNKHLAKILNNMNIEHIYLDKFNIQDSDDVFYRKPWFCEHHYKLPLNSYNIPGFRCSLRKC